MESDNRETAQLAEAIERVRGWTDRYGNWTDELRTKVLAVCDAAARCAEAERERDELKINVASRILCSKDADSHLRRVVAERDEARATLAGIERLLRAGWLLHTGGGNREVFRLTRWNTDHDSPSLPAAIAAAIEEIDRA